MLYIIQYVRVPESSLFSPCKQRLVKGERENPRHFRNLNKLYDLLNTQLLQWFDGARVKHGTLIYCFPRDTHFTAPRIKFRSIFAQQIREYNYKRMPGLKKEESPRRRFVYSRRSSGENIFLAVVPFNNDGFLPLQPPRIRKNLVLGRCRSLTLHVPHFLPPFARDDFQGKRRNLRK